MLDGDNDGCLTEVCANCCESIEEDKVYHRQNNQQDCIDSLGYVKQPQKVIHSGDPARTCTSTIQSCASVGAHIANYFPIAFCTQPACEIACILLCCGMFGPEPDPRASERYNNFNNWDNSIFFPDPSSDNYWHPVNAAHRGAQCHDKTIGAVERMLCCSLFGIAGVGAACFSSLYAQILPVCPCAPEPEREPIARNRLASQSQTTSWPPQSPSMK